MNHNNSTASEVAAIVETYEGLLAQLSPSEWSSPRGLELRNRWTEWKARLPHNAGR